MKCPVCMKEIKVNKGLLEIHDGTRQSKCYGSFLPVKEERKEKLEAVAFLDLNITYE